MECTGKREVTSKKGYSLARGELAGKKDILM
jgi:hypothetical protein